MIKKRTGVLLTGLTIALVAIAPATAHEGRGPGFGPGANPERLVQRMTRHLDLDETQRAQVENVLTAAKPEFEALRERAQVNRSAMRELAPEASDYSARVNDLAAESGQIVTDGAVLFGRVRSEIHAILTPEQIEEAKVLMEERRELFEERRGRRGRR